MKNMIYFLVIALMKCAVYAQDNYQRTPEGVMQQSYIVQGKVTDLVTGAGIGTATVEAVDIHKKLHRTLSNSDGTYQLRNLPREVSVSVNCSQLGYSPNPSTDVVNFKDGLASWNPRLVQENGSSAYLTKTAEYLELLPPAERTAKAAFIAVNLPPESRAAVAAQLQLKAALPDADESFKHALAFFTPGPASDEQIRQAMIAAIQASKLDKSLDKSTIHIEVVSGHAVLTGTVNTKDEKDVVYMRASQVPSAASLDDKIIVESGVNP